MRLGRSVLGLALLSGGVALSATPGAGAASSTPSGGSVQIFVRQGNGPNSTVLITGAIGDYGSAVSVNRNGKVNANGNFEKVKLKKGTFLVDGTLLNQAMNDVQPTFDATNCSGTGTGSGPVTLSNGTGAYKGISGTLTMTITFAFITSQKNGSCDQNHNDPPLSQYQSITGSGTVAFS